MKPHLSTAAAGPTDLDLPPAPSLTALPDDLLVFTFSYLEPEQVCLAALTCSDWRLLAGDEFLWKGVCARRWPGQADADPRLLSLTRALSWKTFYFDRAKAVAQIVLRYEEEQEQLARVLQSERIKQRQSLARKKEELRERKLSTAGAAAADTP